MPGSAAFYGSLHGDPVGTSRELWRTVFGPIGHYRAVADAPGRERLVQDLARAIQGGAFHACVLLNLVAKLAKRHPEVGPSLNRAVAVMRGWKARGGHAGTHGDPVGKDAFYRLDGMAAPRAALGRGCWPENSSGGTWRGPTAAHGDD